MLFKPSMAKANSMLQNQLGEKWPMADYYFKSWSLDQRNDLGVDFYVLEEYQGPLITDHEVPIISRYNF